MHTWLRLYHKTDGSMPGDAAPIPRSAAPASNVVQRKKASERTPADRARSVAESPCLISKKTEWHRSLAGLFLASIAISLGFADSTPDRMLLPIEVLGADGTTVSRTFALQQAPADSVRFLWLQIHGLRYADQACVQVNQSAWMPLPLPNGAFIGGANTIRFRFNQTDGVSSGYRVLAWNFLTNEGKKILPPDNFVDDAPESWTPPLPDAASILAGRELWRNASLAASSLPNSPRIQARCADCHTQDGRDLKYFNFSNTSIIARARFHGLSELQSEQIASYIRSLSMPHPGRPWNPPYQPGPGLDEQPISSWAARAGLDWVLDQDTDTLQYLIRQRGDGMNPAASNPAGNAGTLPGLVAQIIPDIFRPDGNLNARQIPIALL